MRCCSKVGDCASVEPGIGYQIELKEPDILHLMERLEAQGKQPAKQQAKRTGKGKKEGFHGTL